MSIDLTTAPAQAKQAHKERWTKKCVTIRKMQEDLLEADMLHSCVNCDHFNHKTDSCKKFNMKPPTQIIVFSCGVDWLGMIPF